MVPLQLCNGALAQKLELLGYLTEKKKDILVVWIQYTSVRETDGRTDGQTDRHQPTAITALTLNVAIKVMFDVVVRLR